MQSPSNAVDGEVSAVPASAVQAQPLLAEPRKRRCGRPCLLVCSACVLAFAVVAAASLFVIVPRFAQHEMDSSMFKVNNATVDSLSGLTSFQLQAHVHGDVSLADPLPVGVKLHRSSVTLISPEIKGCLLCPTVSGPFAKFDLPQVELDTGSNRLLFEGDFSIQDLSVFTPWTTQLMEHLRADIIVASELHITVMGMLQLHLELNRTLSCSFLNPFRDGDAEVLAHEPVFNGNIAGASDAHLDQAIPLPPVLMMSCTLPDQPVEGFLLA